MEDEIQEVQHIAEIGVAAEQLLNNEGFKTTITLTRARIFNSWTAASSPHEREELHAEQRALDRLLMAIETLNNEGLVAREALRRMNEEA